MTHQDQIRARATDISELIAKRLRVRKGKDLEAQLQRAGRRLPGWVRREARVLVEAEQLLAHPKLAMQADPATLDKSAKRVEAWLRRQDPSAQRRAFWRQVVAANAFNLLFVGLAFLVTLRLAGLV